MHTLIEVVQLLVTWYCAANTSNVDSDKSKEPLMSALQAMEAGQLQSMHVHEKYISPCHTADCATSNSAGQQQNSIYFAS